jgi:hypothetical protein
MSKHHPRWPQYIHRQKMWKCEPGLLHNEGHHLGPAQSCIGCEEEHRDDHTHVSVAYFSTANHFMVHLNAVHKHTWTDVELEAIAAKCCDEQSLHAELCPLCYLTPQGLQATGSKSMQDHVANHLQVLMLLSLRLIKIYTDSSEDAKTDGSSCDAVADASQVNDDEMDEDREQDMTGLPSPPSNSPDLRPTSPPLELNLETGETSSWNYITSEVRKRVPVQETVMDQLLDERKRELRPATPDTGPHESSTSSISEDSEDEFVDKLYSAFVRSTSDERAQEFLPNGLLTELVNRSTVENELQRMEEKMGTSDAEKNRLSKSQLSTWICTKASRLFATVMQSNLTPRAAFWSLVNFFQSDFGDDKLPLEDPRVTPPPSNLFSKRLWKRHNLVLFYESQWRYLAPVFSSSHFHYDLDAHAILPFTGDKKDVFEGGFSSVRKIEIHPAHCQGLESTTVFTRQFIG